MPTTIVERSGQRCPECGQGTVEDRWEDELGFEEYARRVIVTGYTCGHTSHIDPERMPKEQWEVTDPTHVTPSDQWLEDQGHDPYAWHEADLREQEEGA